MKVVLKIPILSSKKEMQRLTSRLVALGRFIAWFIDKLHHFFTTLREAQMFGWTEECKSVFDTIKQYLTRPLILSSPEVGEELYMYLTISDYAVSAILFWQVIEDGKKFVYYVSKALVNIETHYSQVDQMALAMHIATKKLHPYFHAHQVTILTNQPLRVT